MTKTLMFVCHGNICRSPMAEFVCKDVLRKEGREGEITVASSAVSDEEIWGGVGNPVYPPVAKLLKEKGIDCAGKRAVRLRASDADKYDLFVCMDESNLRGAVRILGGHNASKCVKLMQYCHSDDDVSDPWYTRDFTTCYQDIVRGVTALLQSI